MSEWVKVTLNNQEKVTAYINRSLVTRMERFPDHDRFTLGMPRSQERSL